jgi:hypothetical protein
MRPPVPQPGGNTPVGATPGLGLLWRTTWRLWLTLALLGTLTGLGWRLAGSAPDMALALDGAGLALWLCAWPLAQALLTVQARQARHGGKAAVRWRWRLVTALHVWLAAACLALAPAGLLLGYAGRGQLLLLTTQDPYTYQLTTAVVAAGVLWLAGPAALASATALLIALRRGLGGWGGGLAWTTLALLAHLPLLAGLDAALATRTALSLAPLGLPWQLSLPHQPPLAALPLGLGLGQYALDLLRYYQQNTLEAGHYAYLEDLIRHTLACPLGGLALALATLTGLQALPVRALRWRPGPAWPAAFSLLAVVLCQLARSAQWAARPELRYPAALADVFVSGLAALWLGQAFCCVLGGAKPRLGLAAAGWTVLAGAGWLALTMPQLAAGQSTPREACVLAGLAVLLGLAGQGLVARLAQAHPGALGDGAAYAVALAPALPLAAGGPLSAQLLGLAGLAAANPAQAWLAALVAGCCFALAAITWLGLPRRRADHKVPRIR